MFIGDKKEESIIVGNSIIHKSELNSEEYAIEYKLFGKIKLHRPYSKELEEVLKINNINYDIIVLS